MLHGCVQHLRMTETGSWAAHGVPGAEKMPAGWRQAASVWPCRSRWPH